jgi:hypothetical protein
MVVRTGFSPDFDSTQSTRTKDKCLATHVYIPPDMLRRDVERELLITTLRQHLENVGNLNKIPGQARGCVG